MDECQMCDQRIRLSMFWNGWVHSETADPYCVPGPGAAFPKAATIIPAEAS